MKETIEKLDSFGRGIVYHNNKIGFIPLSYPGDTITYSIKEEKAKYFEGELNQIEEKSPNRIPSKCPYFHKCGGCIFQEYDYIAENKWKEEQIKSLVNRFLKEDIKVNAIIYKNSDSYRNKIILHGENNTIGYYSEKSHSIVEIDKCILCNPRINECISLLKNNKINEVLIRTSNDLKEILINIQGECNHLDELKKYCDVLIVNNKVITEKEYILTNIGNKKYKVSSNSFFQINRELTEDLYNSVLEIIKQKKPNNVLDLYCGTGSIGIYVAEYCNSIIGIDNNPSNIEDAQENTKLNNISNIKFICNEVEKEIEKFKDIDCIIVDPPRAGLDSKTREYLNKINPETIIYVSCNPSTLIRDLQELTKQYHIKEITPFNMFPRTHHCESVCILERR